jgi:hypothetical protein
MDLLVILAVLATLFICARFGVDSRPVFDERPEGERFGALT